jgi:hypothetical protein
MALVASLLGKVGMAEVFMMSLMMWAWIGVIWMMHYTVSECLARVRRESYVSEYMCFLSSTSYEPVTRASRPCWLYGQC